MIPASLPSWVYETLISLILGVVQGVTEFLPISSTAHLLLTSEILVGKDIGLSTSNVIQFGTLLAILVFYKSEISLIFARIWEIMKSPRIQTSQFAQHVFWWWQNRLEGKKSPNLLADVTIAQLIVGTLPVIVFALLVRNLIETLRGSLVNIALFLVFGGMLVGVSEIVHRFKKRKNPGRYLDKWEVLTIGLFQCLSVFPGVSRSGSTLAGALLLGRERDSSVRFSFLLAIPAIGLASVYDGLKVLRDLFNGDISLFPAVQTTGESLQLSLVAILLGFAAAYFVGLATLRWLLNYLGKHDSRWFILYRLALAMVIIVGLIK